MTDDPNRPGYDPGYAPGGRGAGAGGGGDFGADLYRIYEAGRVRFPQIARDFYDLTTDIWVSAYGVGSFADLAENPQALTNLQAICTDLTVAGGRSSERCDDAGTQLVELADDYVRTDQAALDEFDGLYRQGPDDLDTLTPNVPEPPTPDRPYDPTPPPHIPGQPTAV